MPPDGQSNLAAGPRTAPEQGTAAAAAFLAPTAQPVPRGPDAQQILPSGTLQPAGAADPGRPDIAAGPAPASRRADPAIRTRAASLPAQATPTPTTGNPLARVQTPNPGANGLATAWQPVAGQALPQSETGDPAELPLDGIESLAGTPIHTDRGAATAASPLRHAASPQHIAQQLAAAAPRPGEQPVELRLNPDELGHVRLTLLQGDGSISVTIQAERGETLELMRRHIAQLEAEFRDIGYSDIQFSFGASGQGGQETWADNGEARSSAAPADPETAPEIVATAAAMPPASGARDGLDLRL
jgi:flagellar hook-length control protein FliK